MRRMYSEKQIKKIIESGDLNVNGEITGDEIIENMSGYSFTPQADDTVGTRSYKYAGIVKNGNKLTLVIFLSLTTATALSLSGPYVNCGQFTLPKAVADKLIPTTIGQSTALESKKVTLVMSNINSVYDGIMTVTKPNDTTLNFGFYTQTNIASGATITAVRLEVTFLLSDNLAE